MEHHKQYNFHGTLVPFESGWQEKYWQIFIVQSVMNNMPIGKIPCIVWWQISLIC